MRFAKFLQVGVVLTVGVASAGRGWSAPASDVLLPAATKAYVAVADPAAAKGRFEHIQLGQLLDDETMQPFVESLGTQLEGKFDLISERLGFTWDDLEGVPAGELSLAIIERPDQDAALAVTIDVAGHESQADAFLTAVEQRFSQRGARKETIEIAGTEAMLLTAAAEEPDRRPLQTVYFVHDDVLCGVNGREQAEALLSRFSGTPGDNLRSVEAYRQTMERCQRAAGQLEPEVRWFVEPFGLTWAARTLSDFQQSRYDKDVARILHDQGFDAIRGVGGFVNMLLPGKIDVVSRVAVWAPPVPGKEDDPLRWDLAMRMLQMPNTDGLVPQSWVPRLCARYSTYNIDILTAFDHVDTLFDALRGHEDAFKTSMIGIEQDAYGPQVNVRDEFIAHLGKRVTLLTNYATPISIKSERSVVALEAADEAKLAATLARIMEKEPDVERREFGQYVIWERVPEGAVSEELRIDVPGFSPLHDDEETRLDEDEDRDRVLPNSAVCVGLGQMFMASDIDFLKELLGGFGRREMLATSGDYRQVDGVMERLAPGPRCGWSFVRTDEAYRPTYELIRQGKMPQSETMLGKALNEMFTTEVQEQEGVMREQRIDGSQLPVFESVRRYFGPAATTVRSETDGWLITSAVLDKQAP